MSELLTAYLDQIRADFPTLDIGSARLNSDGMVNNVVIVNGDLVFRFAKTDYGRQLLAYEAQLLELIAPYVSAQIPLFIHRTPAYVQYQLVPGNPLYGYLLLRTEPQIKERLAVGLAIFLAELHAIPLEGVPEPPGTSSQPLLSRRAFYEQRLAALESDVFPLLWADQKAWVYDLYAPVVEGSLDLDAYTPRLIHRDLAAYHILYDPAQGSLAGIIDFGTAGMGDPAVDWGCLIGAYGESFVRRMHATYPLDQATLDRARFLAGAIELEWALIGIQQKDPSMLLVHIGGARDRQALLTPWE
ncbi:MAG: phosphotransferase [Caldilineaceae bacterium]